MDPSSEYVEFSVLRRWNSFTPLLPTAHSGPGGGYFVRWRGKGIAIDPGFDFLSNLRDSGYDPCNISAIIVTHSHLDHARDLEALFTGKHVRLGILSEEERLARGEGSLDVFVSLDTFFKYGPLITSQREAVFDLQTLRVLTPGSLIKLPPRYGVTLEVIAADHESQDTPWTVHAVGLIMTFLDDKNRRVGSIGFPGDTRMTRKYAERFAGCDVVVGHLGTLSLPQLMAMAAPSCTAELREELKNWAGSKNALFKQGEEELFRTLVVKDLPKGKPDPVHPPPQIPDRLERLLEGEERLVDSSAYSAHSLFMGMHDLFEATVKHGDTSVGVISEFGLELGAFRHEVADALNATLLGTDDPKTAQTKTIVTGDIGLTLRLWQNEHHCERDNDTVGRCPPSSSDRDPKTGECPMASSKVPAESRVAAFCQECDHWIPPTCLISTCVRFRQHAMRYYCPACQTYEYSPPTPLMG